MQDLGDSKPPTPGVTPHKRQSRKKGDIRAIFVHAGAGYHSYDNEMIHLKACEDACKAAMGILKNGGTAVDAVEMAVKVMEDRELTNAGYGSNLTVDGAVEGDAIVIDHYGRSGAVGAVAQVKNPVSLARLVLDRTLQPLPLRRVPPNLLCGDGATRWAFEHGMEILPHEALVSPAAHHRWKQWMKDLAAAERKHRKHRKTNLSPPNIQFGPDTARVEHTQRMLRAGEVLRLPSPATSSEPISDPATPQTPASYTPSRTPDSALTGHHPIPYSPAEGSRNPLINSTQKVPTLSDVAHAPPPTAYALDNPHSLRGNETGLVNVDNYLRWPDSQMAGRPSIEGYWRTWDHPMAQDGSMSTLPSPAKIIPPLKDTLAELQGMTADKTGQSPSVQSSKLPVRLSDNADRCDPPAKDAQTGSPKAQYGPSPSDGKPKSDLITDTVGAIAIDVYGNIAAAASSGGVGMKHQGRVGPAALVGVGASVIPIRQDDPDRLTVASVVSGTGEHMATTMAAQTCADRMYHSLYKQFPQGSLQDAYNDDDVMRSFVTNDFLDHASVKHSITAGAIGVMTVKRTRDAAYMYFTHNTDSFTLTALLAIASMHANDTKPVVCMSRIMVPGGPPALGGRAMRIRP